MKTTPFWLLVVLFIIPTPLLAADDDFSISLPINVVAEEKLPEVAQAAVTASSIDPQKEAMVSQLKQVNETTTTLSQTVDDMNAQISSLKNELAQVQSQNGRFQQQINRIIYAMLGLTVLWVLTVVLALVRGRRQSVPAVIPKKNEPKNNAPQSEYDFMSSSEGIPAKLDLARAYIAMEDYILAKETLVEILNETNEEYHPEAKSLLNKIKE
jgi:FimV-like protein